MANVLSDAGGTTTKTMCPREMNDPMLRERPPWDRDANCTNIKDRTNSEDKNSSEISNKDKLLDSNRPTIVTKVKSCLSTILPGKRIRSGVSVRKKFMDVSKVTNLKEKYRSALSKLGRKHCHTKQKKRKTKGFEKIWLKGSKGKIFKLYTFRKKE